MKRQTKDKSKGLEEPRVPGSSDGVLADGHDATHPNSARSEERQGGGRTVVSNGMAPGVAMEGGMGMGMGMGGGGGGAPISLRNLRTFSSLGNPVFRLFFGSMLSQMGAMNMQMIARSLLVYRITGSAAILGVMALANSLPMLFFSLYGGVLADRVQKKYLLLVGQMGTAVVAFIVAIALTTGVLGPERPNSWWILLVYSLVQGGIFGFAMPARSAIIPEIVRQDQVMNAIALNNFGQNTLRLAAPALAGFLIDLWSFKAIYFLMTGLYLLSTFFVLLMPLTGTISIRGRGAWADMKEGFRYIRFDTTILQLLLLTLVMVLCSMPYMNLLPIFTEDVLNVGAKGMGILVSVSGIGAMAGSLVLASLPNKKRGVILLFSALILGVALSIFAFSKSWYLSLAIIVFVGLGQTGRMTLANALLQTYTPEQYLGRVMSIYMMEFGLTSFSVFFAGLIAEGVGIQWAIGGLAMILVVFTLLVLAFSPRMRRLD